MWGEVIRYAEVTSTNDLAKDHARRGVTEGTVVVSRFQSAGRGRQGRPWVAPPGRALLASIILRPPAALARSAWLTLAGGIAVAEAIKGLTTLSPKLKWPNDVRLDGRKVAGILTETARIADGSVAVVGIGVNVNQGEDDFAEELRQAATSLRLATEREWPLDELLNEVVRAYQGLYQTLCDGGLEAIRQQWLALDETIGRGVLVEQPDSEWHGRATNVDDHGALWVEDAAGDDRRVVVGDVSIRLDD